MNSARCATCLWSGGGSATKPERYLSLPEVTRLFGRDHTIKDGVETHAQRLAAIALVEGRPRTRPQRL